MYATICNNPRSIRYLREETILVMMFPGPHEPNQDQYNNLMEIPVKHFKKLYNGIFHFYPYSLHVSSNCTN
jgi:hypothetical protein